LGKQTVVVALLSADQEFQRFQADDARGAASANSLQIEIVFAEGSAILQIQQLYKFVHRLPGERPFAIVVEPVVGEGLERVARAAAQAGIGWMLINCRVPYLETLRKEYPALPIGSVGTDHVEIGRIQARQILSLVPHGQRNVLYVQGPPDTGAAQERLQGVQEGLRASSVQLRLVEGQWTEASGQQVVERWLRMNPGEDARPAIVACQNDAMAVGARKSLRARRDIPELAHVPVTGVDGLMQGGRALVDAGELAATVVQPSNSGPALHLIGQYVSSGRPLPAQTVLKPESYPTEGALTVRVRPATGRFA
jgi:ABC-type sugar transport system substrate-binding protein